MKELPSIKLSLISGYNKINMLFKNSAVSKFMTINITKIMI